MRSENQRVYLIKSEEDLNRLYDDIEKELVHGTLFATFHEYDPKRTDLQNALWWAYMTDWGNQKGYTKDIMAGLVKIHIGHYDMINHNGTYHPIPRETRNLGVKKMQELIREAEIWASEEGLTIFAPNYRDLALYGEK